MAKRKSGKRSTSRESSALKKDGETDNGTKHSIESARSDSSASKSVRSKSQAPLFIAGVGASSGGLEAFQELLTSLGQQPGLAIVFIQHLDPTSKSLLVDLLVKSTSMEVVELSERIKLKPNTVYVCPPQSLLDMKNGIVPVVRQSSKMRPRWLAPNRV